jgi:hypothetical protein
MAQPPYGYRFGERLPIRMQVDSSSSDIVAGDFVTAATAGYVSQSSAGDTPVGVAMESVSSPSADGDATVLVDVSELSVYEYPPDAGTVTQGLCNTTMDIGGAQSINIDASSDDIIIVRQVDTDANTLLVSLIPTFAGVV